MMRQTLFVSVVLVLRLLVQGVYFLLLTRLLGPADYGMFAVMAAAAAMGACFSGPGAGPLLIRDTIHHESDFRRWFGQSLVSVVLCFPGIVALLVLTFLALAPDAGGSMLHAVIAIAVADLLFSRLADVAAQAFQARRLIIAYAVGGLAVPTARAAAITALCLSGAVPTLAQWGLLYATTTAVGAVAVVAVAGRQLGWPTFHLSWSSFTQGLPFGVMAILDRGAIDLDKLILASFVTAADAGFYAAGQRVMELALTPLRSLFASLYPRFFQLRDARSTDALPVLMSALLPATLLGAASGLVLAVGAPFLPLVLGENFKAAVEVVRILSPLPMLLALASVAADFLTGVGRQTERTAIGAAALCGQIGLNLLLIPVLGPVGAALGAVGGQTLAAASGWARVAWLMWPPPSSVLRSRW